MEGSAVRYIENDFIKVGTKSKGGEWCSFINKQNMVEYLWQADPQYWGRSSCILFPTIGKLKDGQYRIDDQSYHLNQHGFLRNEIMTILSHDQQSIEFSKKSDPETDKLYPFEHEVRMIYRLDGPTLSITYEVYNNSDQLMPFSIGAHPAFRVPVKPDTKRSDYHLRFDQDEALQTMTLDAAGLIGSAMRPVPATDASIQITDDLFDHDALILSDIKSSHVSLIGPDGHKIWTFDFEGFPYLGIWSKNQVSPFVCIEPWHGIADLATASGNLYEKKGIVTIASGDSFTCTHKVSMHNVSSLANPLKFIGLRI